MKTRYIYQFVLLCLVAVFLSGARLDGGGGKAGTGLRDAENANAFCIDAVGTDSYACNLSPAITAYVTGTHYRFKAGTANTGPASLDINGLGAKSIVKVPGGITTALVDNDILAGQWVDVVYDGTNFQMQSTLANPGTGDVTAAAVFAVDNCLIRADGTGKGAQCGSGVIVNNAGDISGVNSLAIGGGTSECTAGTAACLEYEEGTAQSAAITGDKLRIYAPVAVTAHKVVLAGVAATGFMKGVSDGGSPPIVTQSYAAIVKSVQAVVFDFGTATATGDGKFYFRIPSTLNGYNLTAVQANTITDGTTGTINIDLAKCVATTALDICTGTGTTITDMLSTNMTIDTGENDTATAAAAAVIDTGEDDVSTGEVIRIDIDAVHTTPANGLIVNMDFTLP